MSRNLPPEPAASAASDASPRDVLARRRFVRGVFAAPAVMTVCSGSAYADFRSLTCLEKGQDARDPAVEVFLTGSETPVFLRVAVWEKDNVQYVSYNDLQSIGNGTLSSEIPASSGNFLALNPTSGNLTGNVLPGSPDPGLTPTSTPVVVRIDGSGYVVGTGTAFDISKGNGALVSMTCWTSLNGFIK